MYYRIIRKLSFTLKTTLFFLISYFEQVLKKCLLHNDGARSVLCCYMIKIGYNASVMNISQGGHYLRSKRVVLGISVLCTASTAEPLK